MRIGIDPGHGGRDPGAIGPTRLYEKDITLAIARELESLLIMSGQSVTMTRRDDVFIDLRPRTNLLNNAKCDLAISVHINAATRREANYISTFIQGRGGQAEQLAKKVQAELVQVTGWSDGGVRVKNLHMTRETKMPAILVECGFISNLEQEKQLRQPETQKKLAQAITNGVLAYLGIERKGDEVDMKVGVEIPEVKTILAGKALNKAVILNVDGRDTTYIPAVALRDIGMVVNWDSATKTVQIKKR